MRILFLIVLLGIFLQSQSQCSKNGVIELDFNDRSNFEGFEIFDNDLKDVEIVMLGEGLHFYDTDTEIKLKIIRYLHEKLGFNIILMEAGFTEVFELNRLLSDSTDIQLSDAMSRTLNSDISIGIFKIYQYIYDLKRKGDSIIVGGIDAWVGLNPSGWDVFSALRSCGLCISDSLIQSRIIYPIFQSWNKEWPVVTQALNSLDSLIKEQKESLSSENILLVNQYVMNLRATIFYIFEHRESGKWKNSGNQVRDDYFLRDSIMFNNLAYYKRIFPNEKIIVFASTFHVRKSVEPFKQRPRIGNTTKPFGHRVSEQFVTYSIASIYPKVQKPNGKWHPRSKKSIESQLFSTNTPTGIIKLNSQKFHKQSFSSYPIWNFKTSGDWGKAFDALLYIDTACLYSGRKYYIRPIVGNTQHYPK